MRPPQPNSIARLLVGLTFVWLAGAPVDAAPTRTQPAPRTRHVLLFTADGGRPDLFREYAAAGLLPAFARLETIGAMGVNGMLPQLPTSTRVGWQTLSTGAWAGTHGAVNNVYTWRGRPMADSSQFGVTEPLEAETLPEVAERAGLKVLLYDWNSSDQPAIAGPTVKYWDSFTRAGVAQNYDAPSQAAGAQAWGLMFQRLTLSPVAAGPKAPASYSPLIGATLRLDDFGGGAYEYAVLFYDTSNDGRTNYDHAMLRSGAQAAADLGLNDWAEVRLKLAGGKDKGKTAGFYVKLMELDPSLRRVKFFVTAVSRVHATPNVLADYLADHFITRAGVAGPLAWEHLIDEATYAEATALTVPFNHQALPYLLGQYAPDTNLVMLGYLNTDIIQHATLALITPGAPVFDDADRNGRPDGLVAARSAYLSDTYAGADATLQAAWSAMPADTVVAATSDHGFAATWKAVYAPWVLGQAGTQPEPQISNCVASERVLAKACWVGGTAMIYMNVKGREPNGVVASGDYAVVRERIMAAFRALSDHGAPVVYGVYPSEQAAALPDGWGTASMANAEKTGDVIVFLRPPYQFDFAEGGTPIRDTTVWWGAHGHPPQSGDGLANTDLYATFYLAGPGIRHTQPARVRAIDVAPTLAQLLGIPAPAQSEGRVLSELFVAAGCAEEWHPLLRLGCDRPRGR